MVNKEEVEIIHSTIPLLQDKGVEITSKFYKRMFENHPELRNMFNQPNHKQGLQSTALATAVLAAAQHIEDLTPIVPVVMPIAHKHCGLEVLPEHYPIVGENLLAAIQDVTGLKADDPIIQTWGKAYGEIADAFIGIEKDIYAGLAWESFKPFEVIGVREETGIIKSFTVKSDEITDIPYSAGQYITVDVQVPGLPYRAKRHYSIVDVQDGKLTFAVRKEDLNGNRGEVSTYLHEKINTGDTINLSAPVGVFGIENAENPQLFIGSGIGVTPLFPMYRQTAGANADAQFIQVSDDADNIAFEVELKNIAESENAELHTHLRDKEGYLMSDELQKFLKDEQEIYVCGGVTFIQSIVKELSKAGVDKGRVHYEIFIPRLSTAV
ncbi:nitric oxide dioxygenase [Jeotgalicoccus coquinae]|uniref:nitric oxide dioxygenase n=1 Tax=Jeotgalicoccus coquinae TaxID=709509 RepID=A0A6V7R3C7_9STAP|nr:globin domain-containing protein [Jeotgalicoccus coquinae]MBB6423516.1 nitric oxide dioxygenase [Jeotgalicoccus coquinae]GGE20434.1 nitric oxide dioxygenase [Jeotgalicoccus coquinae]CAD2071543.1 Flavohemoprotein [Jeotgalicoccus coquinae]